MIRLALRLSIGSFCLAAAHAQGPDALRELMYPVNPPRSVFSSRSSTQGRELPGKPGVQVSAPTSQAEDEYLLIYQKILQAERLEAGSLSDAVRLHAQVLADLIGLQKSRPDFQPNIVAYRILKTSRTLDRLLSRS